TSSLRRTASGCCRRPTICRRCRVCRRLKPGCGPKTAASRRLSSGQTRFTTASRAGSRSWANCSSEPALVAERRRSLPNISLTGCVPFRLILRRPYEVVADDYPALHHESDPFHFGHVRDRISGHRDDVCKFSLFDRAQVLVPIVVQHLRGGQIGRLQGLRRTHAPFCVIGELVSLLAVRDRRRGRPAPEHDRNAGGNGPPHRLFQKTQTRVLPARGLQVAFVVG